MRALFRSLLLALAIGPAAAVAAETPFELPALPYAADALEPAIDARTMTIHHRNHHGAQVDNLNRLVAADPALAGLSLEAILAEVSKHPPAVRNNAGGHYNHSLFWTVMAPKGTGGVPSPALAARIEADFGSLDAMKQQFATAAAQRFGSGWAWLVVRDGKLVVGSTPNQDNPLMEVAEVRGTPILGLDVWEHAYYLQYQYRRGDYIAGWWEVVDWNAVSRRFDAAMAVARD
jgi:Fe-Mn family superoxide dismutase